MKKSKTNLELRQWARGVSFTIAMGRRQVFTLVSLHLSADRVRGFRPVIGNYHRAMRNFVGSTNCLVDRGLVIPHVWRDEQLRKRAQQLDAKVAIGELWQLTTAGELVIGLLKEAGIYEEVRAELEAADAAQMRIA